MRDLGSRPADASRPRTRLVPPKLGEIERRTRHGRAAERWSHTLRGAQRRRFAMIAGNLALLALLVGGPILRGRYRAHATQRAYASFLSCLYGVQVGAALGALAGQPEYFAARFTRSDRAWLPRCIRALKEVAPSRALFVSPWLKESEERVREAVAIADGELHAAASHTVGARLPDRPVRALQLLRAKVRAQLLQAGIDEREVDLPASSSRAPALAAPARLPLYAAADASLSLWGDDRVLRIVALDGNGLSYLESEPARPFSRARLVRPRLLRGFVRHAEQGWLAWSTPPARCRERGGCFGKTMSVARAPSPLVFLPEARALAAHLAGRPDRSMAPTSSGLWLATASAKGRVQLQSFALGEAFPVGAEWPPLSAAQTWSASVDQAVLLGAGRDLLVLGVTRDSTRAELAHLSESATSPLASLAGGESPWLSACARDGRAGFAFGDGERVVLGTLQREPNHEPRWRAHTWPALALDIADAIDPELAQRDRVVSLCTRDGVIVVTRDRSDQLSATLCDLAARPCRKLLVAIGVQHFSLLETTRGALIAYAGDEKPQVRVRSLDAQRGSLSAERVPAACWKQGGLCLRPTLARLGSRILLVAPEHTDLLALESADEGESWRTPPL